MQPRISEWINKFNISIKQCEERPDQPPGDIVYRVKDLFTTRGGQWDPSSEPGAVPQWARDSYLRPWGAEDYFDDAGADHHIFARVLDLEGKPVKNQDLVNCWSDGFHLLGQPNFERWIKMTITPKERSGWGNQPIWNNYFPEQGQVGAWCWCPKGAADVVVGGGMPYNWHISTFAVWQAEKRGNDDDIREKLLRQAVGKLTVPYAPTTAFAAFARQHNLGAPITAEFDVDNYRAQGFANGIVFARIAEWDKIEWMSW